MLITFDNILTRIIFEQIMKLIAQAYLNRMMCLVILLKINYHHAKHLFLK